MNKLCKLQIKMKKKEKEQIQQYYNIIWVLKQNYVMKNVQIHKDKNIWIQIDMMKNL